MLRVTGGLSESQPLYRDSSAQQKNFAGGQHGRVDRAVLQAIFSRAHRCEALAMVLLAHYPVTVAHGTAL